MTYVLLRAFLVALLLVTSTAATAFAVQPSELERISKRTGLSEEEIRLLEVESQSADNANACTPSAVAKNLQKVVVLCLGADAQAEGHASKPKEIVVVGSKVFTVTPGSFSGAD